MLRNIQWLPPLWHTRQRFRSRSVLAYGILMMVALLLRLELIANKKTMQHDEAISYLAAAGHQRDYALTVGAGRPPAGEWVSAREWQRFMEPDRSFIFGQIAHDLADYDIHPPLYFWLLHGWILIFGTTEWAGPLLNLLIDMGIALALYRLARGFGGTLGALSAVALWALSPVALETMSVARQYGLFTLLTVLYALAQRAALHTGPSSHTKKRPWLALVLIGAAGLLTHYYFILALLAGGIVVLAQRDRRQVARFVVCTALAGALTIGLHPHFLTPVQQGAERGFDWSAMSAREDNLVGTLNILLIPVLAALLLPLIGTLLRGRVAGTSVPYTNGMGQPAIFLVCLTVGPAVFYLGQLSPVHALMDYRYFGPAWPFATLLIVRALDARQVVRLGEARRVLACLGMLILTALMLLPDLRHYARPGPGTRLLIDDTARGILLPLVYHLDGDTPVFAAEPADLLAAPGRWLPALTERGGVYSHYPRGTADNADHDAVLILITASAQIAEPTAPYIWQANFRRNDERVYLITPVSSP